MTQRIIFCDATEADNAYAAHAALLKAEARDLRLRHNPVWTMLKQDAYERFANAFLEAK